MMTQNIYWCRCPDERGGIFLAAPTRARAKKIFAGWKGCAIAQTRIAIVRHGVNLEYSKFLPVGDEDLKRFGLKYS